MAALVGSGLSTAAGIPTGWGITLDLVRRLGALNGIAGHEDWPAWYHSKYGAAPNYSEVIDALASTAAERQAILHGYIDAPDGDEESRRPTKAHQAIARLAKSGAVRVIITTNFDRLIENALRDEGIEPTVIAADDAITGATPLVHAKCTVIKVHGDYLDSRIRNTDAELAAYSPALDGLLDQVFDNFGLLAVGWSGEWDTALRSAILRAPSRRYPFYWAARGSVGGLARDLIDHRGGRVFSIADADSFFVKLSEMLAALAQASRPHPQSIEMALALAKRYCRDDRFAMEWAEFLDVEVRKIRDYVTGPEYPKSTPTGEILNKIVQTFVSRTEILRRACLICGRWGTEKNNKQILSALRQLCFFETDQSGFTYYTGLKRFPATIALYWSLLGMRNAESWRQMRVILSSEIRYNGRTKRAVDLLPPFCYDRVEWKFINDLENRHTPASDFLYDLFKLEVGDIAVSEAASEELFDDVEAIIALEFAAPRVREGNAFWAPLGRFAWRHSRDEEPDFIDRLKLLPDSDHIFSSGLFGASRADMQPLFSAAEAFLAEVRRRWW